MYRIELKGPTEWLPFWLLVAHHTPAQWMAFPSMRSAVNALTRLRDQEVIPSGMRARIRQLKGMV